MSCRWVWTAFKPRPRRPGRGHGFRHVARHHHHVAHGGGWKWVCAVVGAALPSAVGGAGWAATGSPLPWHWWPIVSAYSGPGAAGSVLASGGSTAHAVPEPSSLALLAAGIALFALRRRR